MNKEENEAYQVGAAHGIELERAQWFEIIDPLERVVNQIGGGYNEEFYKDLVKLKEFILKANA